jgi:hypothetical protein
MACIPPTRKYGPAPQNDGNKGLHKSVDTREQKECHTHKENAMNVVRKTLVTAMLAALALLGGCVVVPAGPGYYSHGNYGPARAHEWRGEHYYR